MQKDLVQSMHKHNCGKIDTVGTSPCGVSCTSSSSPYSIAWLHLSWPICLYTQAKTSSVVAGFGSY